MFIWLTFKIIVLCVFAICTRGTLPRYRFDQLTQINWKHIVFIWLGFLSWNIVFIIFFV